MEESNDPAVEQENPLADHDAAKLFVGLLAQQSRDRAWTENQLQGTLEARIKELQKDYVQLFHALEKVAERTDSATAYNALNRFEWKYTDAAKAVGVTKDAYNSWPDNP